MRSDRRGTLYTFVLVLTVVGLCVAAAAIVPLRAVANAAPTSRLTFAWNILIVTIIVCICLRSAATLIKLQSAVSPSDALDAVAHLLGPSFVLAVAWLSWKTANALVHARELERAALTDPLTNLPNRRQFDIAVKAAISNARHLNQPVYLVLIDIDYFKLINDKFGHSAGDAVLAQFALIISSALRSSDIAYRIGGEEFAVIIPGLSTNFASTVIDRIRRTVEANTFSIGTAKTINVTVSIGAACLLSSDTPETLFDRTDAELYTAKRTGRNQTRLAA